jgi:hypothetical protein
VVDPAEQAVSPDAGPRSLRSLSPLQVDGSVQPDCRDGPQVQLSQLVAMSISEVAEAAVQDWFERQGLVCRRIPRTSAQTPDFLVEGDTFPMVLEVKTVQDDDAWSFPPTGEIASGNRRLFHQNKAYRSTVEALAQLRSHDPTHQRLWLVWLLAAEHRWGEGALDTLRGTLLGMRSAAQLDDDRAVVRDVYYATRGTFERLQELDGAFISAFDQAQLLPNEFSPRFTDLRGTNVADTFASAVLCPSEISSDRAWVVDGGCGNRTEDEVRQALATKYGARRISFMDPVHWTDWTTVNSEGTG